MVPQASDPRPWSRLGAFRDAFRHLMSSPELRDVGDERSRSVKDAIRWVYELENRYLTLINWGLDDPELQSKLDAILPGFSEHSLDSFDACSHLMYFGAFERAGLTDAQWAASDVLEVGSGKGAGLNLLTRVRPVRSALGVDLSRYHVAYANANYARPGLRFELGDAEALPFESARFDVVVNIESAHNYPNPGRFFAEVRRVLRPGGTFVFADIFFNPTRLTYVRESLAAEHGFVCVHTDDLSPSVGAALRKRLQPGSGLRQAIARMRHGTPLTQPLRWLMLRTVIQNVYGAKYVQPEGLGLPYQRFVFRAVES